MEYFKILSVLLVLLTYTNTSWQRLVELQLKLDGNCAAYKPRRTAVEVAQKLLRDFDPDNKLTDCCCMNRYITCYMQYVRSFGTLSDFTSCVNDEDAVKQGMFISNIAVAEVAHEAKADCKGGVKNFTGSSGKNTTVTTKCNKVLSSLRPPGQGLLPSQGQGNNGHNSGEIDYNFSHTTRQTSVEQDIKTSSLESVEGTKDKQTGVKQTQTDDGGNNAKTIGGAVGGTLGALGALAVLGPLAYYMYKKLKRNKVDDMKSTTDLFAIPPGVDFAEAPNSVAPAGTS